jgi:arylsulfatase A-like enzyme
MNENDSKQTIVSDKMTHLLLSLSLLLLLIPVWLVRGQFAPYTTTSTTTNTTNGSKKPNVLLCIADDASRHMGAYGYGWVRTPAFDRVAREGLLFTNAYTPNAKCAPSRACLLTGRNPWQLEQAANHVCHYPAKFKTFMEALGEKGYFTGHTQKGWGPGSPGMVNGKERQLTGRAFNEKKLTPPTTGISDNDYAANFADFLQKRPEGAPFCFWFGAIEPHRGYEYGSGQAKGGKKRSDIPHVPAYWPDRDTVRTDMLDYAYELEYVDRHLERMLALLQAQGELDNTIIVVTSDHGMPFPRVKGQAYDASNHVPLIIRWPAGIGKPGRAVTDLVSLIDLAPTLLEAAGVNAASSGMQPIQGRSLRSIFKATKDSHLQAARSCLLIGQERHDVGRPHDWGYPVRGIVSRGYLYLKNYQPTRWPAGNPETGYLNTDAGAVKTLILNDRRQKGSSKYWDMCFGKHPPEELYDLGKDPDCVQNLATDRAFANILAGLYKKMVAELIKQNDPRMFGKGYIFDRYEYADETHRNFYHRYMNGEKLNPGWVEKTDFEHQPLD